MRDRFVDAIIALLCSGGIIFIVICFVLMMKQPNRLAEEKYKEAVAVHKVNLLTQKNDIYRSLIKALVRRVVKCESGGRHISWGDVNYTYPAYGIAQFQERTFIYLKDLADMPHLQWRDEADQLTLLEWSIENGYGNYWTCYRKIVRENDEFRRHFG